MNRELPDVQAGFRKGRGTRVQIAHIPWIIEKAREFQESLYLCFNDYTKTFDCVDHNKLWKTLKDVGIPDHLTCLLRNLYVSQEATVRRVVPVRTNWLVQNWVTITIPSPSYLIHMQRTSCEMLAWMSYKLESSLPGEISTASDMGMVPL